jgi:hypothetical protein
MKADDKTSKKRPAKPFRGAIDGKPFTKDNQPSPEAKSKGWEARRAERLLTQKIIEKLTGANNLEEYVDSLFNNAKMGNAKAIDTLNNGIEEQITKTETTITDTRPPSTVTMPDGTKIEI